MALSDREGEPSRGRTIFIAVAATAAALLAGFQLYVGGILNPDGVAYSDLADAFLRGDFRSFVIAYWSPVYPVLIAAFFSIFRPAPLNELYVLYALNSVIFGLLFVLFFRLLKILQDDRSFDPWFYFVGFSSFLFCSLLMIGVPLVTPDLLVAVFVLCLSLLLLRVIDGRMSGRDSVLYGLVLGLGYLTKLSLLPLGLSVIVLGMVFARQDRRTFRLLIRTMLIFGTIVILWAVPLSILKARPTLGDIGKLTYAWHVRTVKNWIHWTGGPTDAGVPLHPPAMLSRSPRVYVFQNEFPRSTYPLWYDPSYWYEGLRGNLDLSQQITATTEALRRLNTMCRPLVPVLAALLILLLSSGRPVRSSWRRVAPIVLMAAIGIGMYLFVYIERRYVGGFVAILIIALLWPLAAVQRRTMIYRVCCLVIGVSLVIATIQRVSDDFYQRKILETGDNRAVASAISRAGVPENSHVAILSEGFTAAGWARLARLHIVCDMEADDVPLFWNLGPLQRIEILHAMKMRGIDFVIAPGIRRTPPLLPWERVGRTGLFVLRAADLP